jgi:hypothetical protein
LQDLASLRGRWPQLHTSQCGFCRRLEPLGGGTDRQSKSPFRVVNRRRSR